MADFSSKTFSVATVPVALRAAGAWARSILENVAWTLLSLGFFAGLWEVAWALGWTSERLLPPPHVFLGNFLEQAQYFRPALRWGVGVDTSRSHPRSSPSS